ncbi:hypothetical protein GGI24_005241, partial [Coemansia furcata]
MPEDGIHEPKPLGGLPRTITFTADETSGGGGNQRAPHLRNLRTIPSREAPRALLSIAEKSEKTNVEVSSEGAATDDKAKNVDITEHLLSLTEVCDKFSVQANADHPQDSFGLSSTQAADLLASHGPNTLTPPKKKSSWRKFLTCVTSLFNLMLIAAGILEYILLGIDYQNNKAN